jgi:hypothetical protein
MTTKWRSSHAVNSAVNWAIVFAALALAVLLVVRFGLPPRRDHRARREVRPIDEPGAQAPPSMLDWQTNGRTLLVAVGSPACVDCRQRAPFFQRLMTEGALRNLTVVTVVEPPLEEATAMLAQMGIQPRHILVVPFTRIRLRNIPALILVDRGGTVRRVWNGNFDEAAVLAGLR